MTTVEEIKKAILKKVIFVTGHDLILKEDFDNQLSDIMKNFITACDETKSILNWTGIDWFKEKSHSREDRIRINETLNKYYKRSNSWVEKWWWQHYRWKEDLPLGLYYLFSISESGQENQIADRGYIWDIIQNAEKYLKSENLSEVIKYYVNITNNPTRSFLKIYNSEKSFSDLKEFRLIIFLLSNRRIIKLVVDDKQLISSKENIIQKDLKKIEIEQDVNLFFHYHGLHDPDLLVMDDYQSAADLRRKISELREMKFIDTDKKNK